MYPVVTDLERRQAGRITFALFQLQEIGARVVADAAQLVELLIVARGNHAPVADQYRRVLDDGALEKFSQHLVIGQSDGQLFE